MISAPQEGAILATKLGPLPLVRASLRSILYEVVIHFWFDFHTSTSSYYYFTFFYNIEVLLRICTFFKGLDQKIKKSNEISEFKQNFALWFDVMAQPYSNLARIIFIFITWQNLALKRVKLALTLKKLVKWPQLKSYTAKKFESKFDFKSVLASFYLRMYLIRLQRSHPTTRNALKTETISKLIDTIIHCVFY